MSLKAELETWAAALKSYDSEDFSGAMDQFNKIADTSKICWNIGIILATLGRHKEAVERFEEAVSLDGFMTIGYHQKGVSNFMLGRYDEALKDFEDAFLYLRGNQTINYEQLGLTFRLYAAEILFNCGLVKIYLGQVASGMQDLREAQTQKANADHNVIDDAIRDQGRDYNVFSVPVGILFRPPPAKLRNLATRDYMGKAVLVAASSVDDAYTTFTGITRLQRGLTPTGAPLDPSHPPTRSASVNAIPTAGSNTLPPIAARMSRRSNSEIGVPVRPTVDIDRLKPMNPSRPSATSPSAPLTRLPPRSFTRDNDRTETLQPSPPPPRLDTRVPQPGLQVDIEDDPILQTPEDDNALRLTQMYDDYYKSPGAYDDDIPDLPPIGDQKKLRVEAWAKKTPMGISPSGNGRNLAGGMPRTMGSRPPPSSFSPAVEGPGGLRRWPSRAASIRSGSRYEDDGSEAGDMAKIRVKVHVGKLTRGMSIVPEDTYDDFVRLLSAKFPELASEMVVKFRDEDGDMMTMQDDGDYEAAVDVARVHAKGSADGRLEIWIE